MRLPGSLGLLLLGCAACGGGNVPLPVLSASTIGDTTDLIARGEYVVRSVAVCGHCHAADPQREPDGPLSGGMAFKNWRLGTVRASNLTPDSATGLGAWSDAEIVRSIRTGEDRDGDLLAPVMPYEWYHEMSDHDALAVVRYLRKQPPVINQVRNDPNFVYELALALFLKPKTNPARAATVNRAPTPRYGKYLALHVAICVDCHTRRHGVMSQTDRHSLFAGDATPPSGFPANPANITPDTLTGIGRWSEAEFVRTLRTGINPKGDTLSPFMPREYKRMTDDDLRAIYRYLRTVPAIRNWVPKRKPE